MGARPGSLANPDARSIFARSDPVFVNTSSCLRRLRRTSFALPLAISAMWLVTSCVPSRSRASADPASDPYLVVASELESSVRANLYDALFELRPRWFTRSNRAEPFVYVDDQVQGTVGVLRRFLPHQVALARYLSPTEAQVQYGQRNLGRAAIVLTLGRN